MKRFFLGIAALTAFTLLIAGGARAEIAPRAPTGEELAAQLKNVDDATLQKSAHAQADAIRQIPNELRAQGIAISADQEERIERTADALEAQSAQPGFRNKVEAALKSVGHGLKVVAIDAAKDTGKGIGYAGTAVLAASITPITFTGDLVMGIAVGHGAFSKDPAPKASPSASPGLSATSNESDPNVDTVAGHFEYEGALGAGIAGFYFTYVGLSALGYAIAAPMIGSALGVVTVNWLVCARFDNNNPELHRYCSNNAKLAGAILHGSARGGAIIGEGIHKGVMGVVHFLERPFRHRKKPSPQPNPGPGTN